MKRKLAVGFVDFLDRKTSLTEDDREKCIYIAALFIGELMHLGVLGVFFWRIGYGSEFLISLGTVSLTRTFAGGLHSKSDVGCFLHTFAFFLMAAWLAKYSFVRILTIPVCGLLLCVFLKYAPIASEQRGQFGTKMRKRLKNYSSMGLIIMIAVMRIFSDTVPIVTSTLLLELGEYVILIMRGRRGETCGS